MEIRQYLLKHLETEAVSLWGEYNRAYLEKIADDWLDSSGRSGADYRITMIRMLLPGAYRILDMGAGCGTFIRYALEHGFDAYGIEPEQWKRTVALRMVSCLDMPVFASSHMQAAVGEVLPFSDNAFDCTTTFQTMEHVQDVVACCREMLRVTRVGGGIYIRCPDYALSTFEGHYRLPWCPYFKGNVAERYLKLLRKPIAGYQSLQPVSARELKRIFIESAQHSRISIRVENIDYIRVLRYFRLSAGKIGYCVTRPLFILRFLRLLFRIDYPVHMIVYIDSK